MITPKKLSEILPPELQEGQAEKLDEYLDKPIVVHTCREVKGTNGTYMRLVASLPGDEKQFYLSTGASQPFEVLQYLKEHKLFPVEVTFSRVGRAILVS